MKIIIAGSRSVENEEFIYWFMDRYLSENKVTWVICGMAEGPDLYGKNWAEANGIPVDAKPADWKKYGNQAGPLRNIEMSKVADALIAFWDGSSPGTKHMIRVMNSLKKDVQVIYMPKKEAKREPTLEDMFNE